MKTYKKLSIIFSLGVLTFFAEIAINMACGPEPDPYDEYATYFLNTVDNSGYEPFRFVMGQHLYDGEEPESDAIINSREWASYLKRGVKATDVLSVMYHSDSATSVLLSTMRPMDLSSLPDTLKDNGFVKAILSRKYQDALAYFQFAKSVEPLATFSYSDYWNPDPRDMEAMYDKGVEAEALANGQTKNQFLRLRYAYQAARMYHYSGTYDRCIDLYESLIAPLSTGSAIKGWCTSLYAGALRRMGQKEKAAYMFSRVFDTNPERRVLAYKNYQYIEAGLDPSVLELAKNDHEKAVIWAINGLGDPQLNMEYLRQIYSLTPTSNLVGTLLIREVNKLEQFFGKSAELTRRPYYYSYYWHEDNDENTLFRLQHLNELTDFALKIADEKVYPNAGLGHIVAAYLTHLAGEEEQALALLARVDKRHLSGQTNDQYRITELLLKVNRVHQGGDMDENSLIDALQWLDEKRRAGQPPPAQNKYWYDQHKEERFGIIARNIYHHVLMPVYLNQGDTVKAALLAYKGDFIEGDARMERPFVYMSMFSREFWKDELRPTTLLQLAQLKQRPSSDLSPFERFLTIDFGAGDDYDLLELLGTAYLRVHDYGNATKTFAKLPADFLSGFRHFQYCASEDEGEVYKNENNYADPFIMTLKDYPKQYSGKPVTKREFAERMWALEKQAKAGGEEAASAYFELANGAYQTGEFGNSWFLISYDWSSDDKYAEPARYYDGDYLHARQAEQWYEKARALSTDTDFKAKCTFMLAKCTQRQYSFDSKSRWSYYESPKDNPFVQWSFYRNPYFKELKEKYQDTEFFGIATRECSYFREFLNARP